MSPICTVACIRFQRQAVQQFFTAICQHIINIDLHLRLICFHTQINRVKVCCRLSKDFIIIKGIFTADRIGLLTARATNVVIHSIFRIDFAILQRIRTCKGVIMPGKHHVDSSFFCRRGDIGGHRCAAASGICIICRLMDCQDFPCCVARLRILNQPIHRRLHVSDITTVIHNCHIYIAVGCRPAAARSMCR